MTIVDRYNRSFDFVRPFLAVDRSPKDSQVLLGRPALKDFKINICNSNDSWEFEFKRTPKVSVLSSEQFAKEMKPNVQVFEVKIAFNPEEEEAENNTANLDNVPERIRERYADFFNMQLFKRHNRIITIKKYIHIYNRQDLTFYKIGRIDFPE